MDKSLRPLTLLVAAACAWALALLVLSLLGLGGRMGLRADEGTAPALPEVTLRALPPRLGAPEAYAEVGQRPLLNFDRRPAAVAVAEGAEGGAELDATLTSVMITSSLKLAIVRKNDAGTVHRVRLGERVEGTGWTLVSLEPRRAIFEGPGGQRAMDLRAFNGQGGEAPTAVAAVAPAATPPAADAARPAQMPTPPPSPQPAAVATAQTAPPAPGATPAPLTQEQQVEAIRRRIEARRAQMRQENARAAAQPTK